MKNILVIGAGTMGRGIAQYFVEAGANVHIFDQSQQILEAAIASIKKQWERLQQKAKISEKTLEDYQSRLQELQDLRGDLSLYNLVIEAVKEDLTLKQNLFKEISGRLGSETILASNTSSLSLTNIFSILDKDRRSLAFGIHFFNPAPIMPLVELIPTVWSKAETLGLLRDFFLHHKKIPVVARDCPGFIVNRVARSFYGEALRIVEWENTLHMREIDEVMREVGGFPMGPFELMDFIGIDVNYQVTLSIWENFYYNPRFAPHLLQKQMVDAGHLGRKSNRGFYSYEPKS